MFGFVRCGVRIMCSSQPADWQQLYAAGHEEQVPSLQPLCPAGDADAALLQIIPAPSHQAVAARSGSGMSGR